jgi:hypothetical protein
MTVTNSTFAGNSADKFGGGILLNQLGATSFLKSTMLAASFGGNCVGTVTDERYNISDDPTCAFGAIGSQNSTDPKLDQPDSPTTADRHRPSRCSTAARRLTRFR